MNEANICLKVCTPSGVNELHVTELLEVDGRPFVPVGDTVERFAFLEGRIHAIEQQFLAIVAAGG